MQTNHSTFGPRLKIAVCRLLMAGILIPAWTRAQTLTDIGTANPTPGPNDISQLSTNGNAHLTGSFNYFTDNGTPPGQTFTTRTKPVVLGSLFLRTGSSPLDSGGGGLGPQTYQLRIFSVSGSTATLLTAYTNSSTFSYTDGDWLRWTNLTVALAANATYGYTFRRSTNGYGGLAVASGNKYTGGAAALIPSAGGTITFESSGTYDAAFVIGLSTNSSQLLAGTPVVSPGTAYIGSAVTVSSAAVGNSPISYQWQSGGASGSLTNVPNATNATLTATPPGTGTYRFDYIATNSSGSVTSSVATATVIVGTPVVSPGNSVYIGSPITLTSPAGAGNPPLSYQWQSGGAGALTNVPNANNVSLTVTPPGTGTFRFDYIVNNGSGSFTSSVATVTVLSPVTVTLNPAQTMAAMPLEGLGVASAVYDNYLVSAGTGTAISNAGVKIVRYPGGSYADIFHWQTTTSCGGYIASGAGFDNWINNTVKPAGAKAIITINYGSNPTCDAGADPSEAAAWVNYANNVKGLGIKYWEIGNEQGGNGYYGTSLDWEYDLHYPETNAATRVGQPALSPAAYGSNSLAFINAMKAQDSTIKCGIGFDTGRQSYNAAALPPVSNVVDFVIIHWYPGGTDAQILQSPSQIAGTVSSCRSQISQYVGSRASQVGIAVTETGSSVPGGGGSDYAADTFLTWIENGALNVDYQELHNGFLAAGISGVANNSLLGPAYGAKMARLLADVGDTMLKITSSTSSLHVHASARQDGKTGVMLINTDPLIPIAVTVNISGPTLASSGIRYQFGQTNFIGTNIYPSYAISSNNVSGLGNTFTVTVPAYTLVNLLIPPAQTNTAPLFAVINNQAINVGSNFQFTASATDTDLPPQTLTYALLSGPASATLNPNTGAFSWRPFVANANTTNPITLKVADNGTPSLSATQSFTVTVNPLTQPGLGNISVAGGQFSFSISGQSGPDYAIETSTNLTQWSDILITNSPALPFVWTDTNLAAPQRFYRVKLGPPLP